MTNIDEEITQLEQFVAECRELIDDANDMIADLQAMKKRVAILHFKMGRVRDQIVPASAGPVREKKRRREIAAFILQHGPSTKSVIEQELQIPGGSVRRETKSDWFDIQADGRVNLTMKGKKEMEKKTN